jgi:hypothetical protein
MKKPIIILIIVVLIIGTFLFLRGRLTGSDEIIEDFSFDFLGINLRSSDLDSAELPWVELDSGLDFDDLGIKFDDMGATKTVSPKVSFNSSVFNISSPEISVPTMPIENKNQGGVTSDNCKMFSAAPDCSFIPENHRAMCEACKKAGY